MQKLLIATQNQGKVAEYADLMVDLAVEWIGLADIGITHDVDETGTTFIANATLKAEAYAAEAQLLTLADDSGLEVDALNGDPGVYTARYGGAGLTHEDRYMYLLENLKDVPEAERGARFRCVIVVANASGKVLTSAEGICEGRIAFEPVGSYGFGYDPVFIVEGRSVTMAQLPPSEKHPLSHRGRAIAKLAPELKRILSTT